MNGILLGLACLLSQEADPQAPEAFPEDVVIELQTAAFYKKPSTLRGVVRKAEYGEPVTVIGSKGRFWQVRLGDGTEAWVTKESLIARKDFKYDTSDEKQAGKLKAQGFEAGRFNPETEQQYRAEQGQTIDAAYVSLDALEARRPELEARMKALMKFREEGKLGEFASK